MCSHPPFWVGWSPTKIYRIWLNLVEIFLRLGYTVNYRHQVQSEFNIFSKPMCRDLHHKHKSKQKRFLFCICTINWHTSASVTWLSVQCESVWSSNRASVMPISSISQTEKTVMQCDFLCGWFRISRLEVNEARALPPTLFHCVAPQWMDLACGTADWAEGMCVSMY